MKLPLNYMYKICHKFALRLCNQHMRFVLKILPLAAVQKYVQNGNSGKTFSYKFHSSRELVSDKCMPKTNFSKEIHEEYTSTQFIVMNMMSSTKRQQTSGKIGSISGGHKS